MTYNGTLLPEMVDKQDQVEVRKAILDLLDKINKLSASIVALEARVKALEVAP